MPSTETKQGFTIATATATLPLVSQIVESLVGLSQEISDTQERLAFTVSDHEDQTNVYSNELRSVRAETDKKSLRLEKCFDELLELNTFTSGAEQGFVDFPACRSGQKICLCWQLGEAKRNSLAWCGRSLQSKKAGRFAAGSEVGRTAIVKFQFGSEALVGLSVLLPPSA